MADSLHKTNLSQDLIDTMKNTMEKRSEESPTKDENLHGMPGFIKSLPAEELSEAEEDKEAKKKTPEKAKSEKAKDDTDGEDDEAKDDTDGEDDKKRGFGKEVLKKAIEPMKKKSKKPKIKLSGEKEKINTKPQMDDPSIVRSGKS